MMIAALRVAIAVTALAPSIAGAGLPLPLGTGTAAPTNVAPAPLANSLTEVYQYGPGVWSTPGTASLTAGFLYGRMSGTAAVPPLLPAACCSYVPFLAPAAAAVPADVMVNNPPTPFGPGIGVFGVGNTSYLSSLSIIFGPTLAAPLPVPLPADGALSVNPPPSGGSVNIVQMGAFSSAAMIATATAPGSYLWTQDYFNRLYHQLTGLSLASQSRGKFLYQQIITDGNYTAGATGAAQANQDYFLRQILYRDNEQVASARAIGLNPMWPIGGAALPAPPAAGPPVLPVLAAPPNPPVPPTAPLTLANVATFPNIGQLPDYILDINARYYFQESYKRQDVTGAVLLTNLYSLSELGLLYQVFADALSYQSGWINTRYPILDPSCRSPQSTGGCNPFLASDMTTSMPTFTAGAPSLINAPWRLSFGSASQFAIVYSVMKYLASSTSYDAQAIAKPIVAPTNDLTAFKNALTAKGLTMPTTLAQTTALANTLFNNALTIFEAYNTEGTGGAAGSAPMLHAPRPSAAFIAAAAIAGKKVDPVFWGTLAEAEQLVLKDAYAKGTFSEYTTWAGKLWSPAASGGMGELIQQDFGLSLTEFGSFRTPLPATPTSAPPENYVGTLPWAATTGLSKILKTAFDGTNFDLVRGPAGLMSLSAENISLTENYMNVTSPAVPTPSYPNPLTPLTPYPNAFLEVAATGRNVIDGRLLFKTDGSVSDIDIDDATVEPSTHLLPFEIEIISSYTNVAATLWGIPPGSVTAEVATLAANSIALPGNANTNAWLAANKYGLLKGNYQQAAVSPSDSRAYQPALQYWLIIAEKLGNTGGPLIGGYVPPALNTSATVTYGAPFSRTNYKLMNVQTIQPNNYPNATAANPGLPGPPKFDHITTDINKNALPGNAATFSGNNWALYTGYAFSQSVHYPFATLTNVYAYPPLANAQVWPLPTLTAATGAAGPGGPATATGANSAPGLMLQFYQNPAPNVESIDPKVVGP